MKRDAPGHLNSRSRPFLDVPVSCDGRKSRVRDDSSEIPQKLFLDAIRQQVIEKKRFGSDFVQLLKCPTVMVENVALILSHEG